MDYKELTDEQFEEARQAILIEQERRTNLAQIPGQVADLCRTYREGGGDPQAITEAVTGDTGTEA